MQLIFDFLHQTVSPHEGVWSEHETKNLHHILCALIGASRCLQVAWSVKEPGGIIAWNKVLRQAAGLILFVRVEYMQYVSLPLKVLEGALRATSRLTLWLS